MSWIDKFKSQGRAYYPTGICFLLGFFFLLVPQLAVLLIVSGLFFLGTFYGLIVYRIQAAKKAKHAGDGSTFYYSHQEPNFRNVTVIMKDSSGIFKKVTDV